MFFLLVITFVIPYSASLYGVKKPLATLILAFTDVVDAPLDSTYCIFVPFIFAWLVYLKRKDLEQTPIRESRVVSD